MKKGFFVVLCLIAAQVFGITPTVVNTLKFSTWGYDCYSDMEGGYHVPVLAGECYALVWTSNEVKEFPGLPAVPLNPDRPAVNGIWVAEYFPVAEDDGTGTGCMHCPDVSISGLDMWDNTNGTWAVYLLDTRYLDENGEVACGFDASVTNAPRWINAYVAVTENFTIGTSAASPSTGKSMKTTTVKGGRDPADVENYEDMVADQPTVIPEFTISCKGNGGLPASQTITRRWGETYGDLSALVVTREGYALTGWTTEAGVAITSTTTVYSDEPLLAQWSANNYSVAFNSRGGEGAMDSQPMTWDEEAALYSNLYARVGYAFLGWTDDQEELEEVLYYDGVVVSNLTDVADGMFPLYAVWEANCYSVTFDANGGEGEMEAQEFVYDQQQALAANEFQKEDCYFLGWATGKTGEVVYQDGAQVVNLASEEGASVQLYAVWSLQSVKRIVPGAKVSFATEDADVFGEKLVGYTVTGLPNGLKYDKNKGTISGSVTKEEEVGTHQVVFTKGADEREMQLVVEEIPTISVELWGEKEGATDGCVVTGAGAYLVGKKATLKATMPKATKASTTIFLGWYRNDEPWPDASTYKKASVSYTMTEDDTDVKLVAKFGIETADNLAVTWSGVGAEGRTFVTGVAGAEDGMPVDVATVDGSSFSGIKSVKVTNLPSGMSYDAKRGRIVGAPTKANVDATVTITVTTVAGVVQDKTFNVRTVPMAAAATGTFNGFVVRETGAGVWEDVGTFSLTAAADGKLSAKAVTSAKSLSFSGKSWDSISAEDGTYRVTLTTSGKDPVTLTLKLDPNAPWNGNQLTGTLGSDGVTAQRKAFGTPWYFSSVSGDETSGWALAYTTDPKAAALTVTLGLDGSTKISGSLKGKAATYKVSASGFADVSKMTNGVFIADFAPVLTVGGKKKVLSVYTRLWMDRSNEHQKDDIGIGDVKFTE